MAKPFPIWKGLMNFLKKIKIGENTLLKKLKIPLYGLSKRSLCGNSLAYKNNPIIKTEMTLEIIWLI